MYRKRILIGLAIAVTIVIVVVTYQYVDGVNQMAYQAMVLAH